jgi:serine/threonine protein kinase
MPSAYEWDQVQRIFLSVVDLAPTARNALLDELCRGETALRGEVESLLESDLTSEVALSTAFASAIQKEAASMLDPSRIEGKRLGAYRLIREIGRGGMGWVYLAQRADEQYESDVAIKVVRPGLDTDFILRRFRRERQILARMHHPNIAQLLDGGTENKTPYLVMEYVEGSRITKFADDRRLSVEGRVRLFLPVCSAVEYAHRAFIVHRDLKPGNILVDATGTPKLLDFGLSKLLHSEIPDPADSYEPVMATPDYASPEQIMGDAVTVASDVYSLGAVLYEFLSGARPHRIEYGSPRELERAICEEPTVPPSMAARHNPALARRLAGDLDSIVLRAMQRDPVRRYPSVQHLADDLGRYLEHRPVMARADLPGYRLGKFMRRNSHSVASIGAVAAVAAIAVFAVYEARTVRKRLRRAAVSNPKQNGELAASCGIPGELKAHTRSGVRAYARLVEITRARWEEDPSDLRVRGDYGAAQVGLGITIPEELLAEKRAALERACDWLTAILSQYDDSLELRGQLDAASRALAALTQSEARL